MNNQPKNEPAATPSQSEPEGVIDECTPELVAELWPNEVQPDPEKQLQPVLARSTGIPEGSEESLSEWYDWVERNQRENQRQEEENKWERQLQLQEETDDA